MSRAAKRFPKCLLTAATAMFLLALLIAGQQQGGPVTALPIYARRYAVTCQTCHTVAPRLNRFGLAFQANNFNWPGHPPMDRQGLNALPLSGIVTLSTVGIAPEGAEQTAYRDLALYSSNGFSLAGRPNGGYLARLLTATNTGDVRSGDFDSAFAALPIAGRRGQWALLAGQMAPINYSWDDHNDLTDSMPMALSAPDGFSLENPMPGFRLDYFSNRGRRSPDGDYLSIGAPFGGLLALNAGSRWGRPAGAYGQAFRRHGDNTLGVFGSGGDGESLAGLIGSQQLVSHLYVWEAAAAGSDAMGHTGRLSVQLTCTPTPSLGLVGRLEAVNGAQNSVYPVVDVTCYPFRQQRLRLAAETVQQPAHRSNTVFVYVQF